ncbi:hypothetical protein GGU10DRAFT_347769 [Lentinula aff. detonsa]|uniref:Uncharacterized protein n=1 Tax=Lentinula aff. detonsa TaxID=2804958 RepID=A0AA38KHM4_9AGAR|nr:hypothetical protein GGU10DRAFT_347769 [Lentinula aff. detonsa]
MIIDEKWMHPPPPPYYRPPPPAFTETSNGASRNGTATFSTLPAHLLLQIVYSTFPQRDGRYEGEGKIERQRQNLYWLETSLRLVNKALYTACMHILRSTYLPAYDSLIRSPYTSDPFSSSVLTTLSSDSGPVHRELASLDLFIALLAHEDLLLDATSLHLPREEAYKDLFDMVQPRSRLEDLILEEGVKAGLVYIGNSPPPLPSTDNTGSDNLEAVDSARPEVTVIEAPATNPGTTSASHPSPQSSPSPTKHSFNPFSRSSYISLAKSKIRRTSTPPSPSTPTGSGSFASNDAKEYNPNSPTPTPDPPSTSSTARLKSRINPLPFDALGVSFSPRRVALIYTPAVSAVSSNVAAYNGSTFGALSVSVTGPTAAGGMKAKKTLVEVSRGRDEQLEVSAKRLIDGLHEVLAAGKV